MLAASALVLSWCAAPATAATLTWNTTNGTWNLTGTNTVWDDGTSNVAWTQASSTIATNDAVFAGADGTYAVAISTGATVNALSVTFNNSGYTVSGGTLALRPSSTTNSPITVAAGKTATINAPITYSNNAPAAYTINAGSTLNLGGGATNSQYGFAGDGTVNITGGSYEANAGNVLVSVLDIEGGALNYTPGASNGVQIGSAATRDVSVTVSGGSLTLNNTGTNSTATAPWLSIGNNATNVARTATLTVSSGGTVIVANQGTRAGEIRIANSGNSNGLFDVQGGSVNVGVGSSTSANQIYLFKNGATDGYAARFAQSGGTVLANGIQFGGTTGTYGSAASASLELSGGTLSMGAAGITKGSGASGLVSTIALSGGILGAEAAWSSPLDMQLGTSGGGVTFSSESTAAAANSITLSGILSDASAVNGTLTKAGAGTLTLSGANTYSGNTTINTGTLALGATGSIASSSAIAVASGATFDVSAVSGYSLGASQTLSGSGSVLGDVTNLGTIAPGASPGTLSFANNLSLGSSSILDYELNGADMTVGSGVNDLSSVAGNLTLAGTLNVTALNPFSSANVGDSWRLFNYTGTLTNNTLSLGTMPALGTGLTFEIDTATGGQVNLVVVPEPATILTVFGGLGLAGVAAARRRWRGSGR